MKCVVCKQGETTKQLVTITYKHDGMECTLTNVPGLVCNHCGEKYIEEAVISVLMVKK